MKYAAFKRLAAGALCVLMLLGQLPKSTATSQQADNTVAWQKVDNDRVSAEFLPEGFRTEAEPLYGEEDTVRVSIVLDKKPTLSVYSGRNVLKNSLVVSYRQALERRQQEMAASISRAALNSAPLDVVWNLTLAANSISANVPYGSIDAIKAVEGVAEVFLEQRYDPCVVSSGTYDPKMQVSTGMTGTTQAWASGFTGAGSRVAIIDTGLDIDHQSVDDDAFRYSLDQLARERNMTPEAFLAGKDLLDQEEIDGVLTQLHAYTKSYNSPADRFYISSKIPFAFNYVDGNFKVTHMTDSAGDHGSHVAGISAANRFIPRGDGTFAPAMEKVHMVGAAPDAQIIVMKVFGAGGGAYESDYMAAVEDAIVLGCDTVNLSLGANNPGMSTTDYYQGVMDSLERSGTIATIAASNSGYWSEHSHTPTGLTYAEDVMLQTTSAPSTYTNALSVASVNNDGMVGRGFYVPDRDGHFTAYNEPSGYGRQTFGSLDISGDGSGTAYDFIWVDGLGEETDYASLDLEGKVVFCSRGELTFGQKAAAAAGKGALALVVYNDVPGSFNMNLEGYDGSMPCVSISQTDGQAIRAAAADQGSCRTGRILITGTVSGADWDSDYYTMNATSSWGVPGDLTIKPEISAPGGNIWSLKGTEDSHDQYQVMSGTSMAAPQVAGIGALVRQAILERNISQAGLSDRALAQSLMMSTAVPMKDGNGNYYPILQQGAGLVNAGAAASADAYITVAGMADGKVKVELGDDPDRGGRYAFTFTIHNLDGAERSYALRGDVFTQDTQEEYGFTWLSLHTQPLAAAVTGFAIAGSAKYDFNGDGAEDPVTDGQALLAYASGHRESISCRENADLSGDGQITTYDAHLFLNRQEEDAGSTAIETVTVPAGGSVDITASITLDSGEMAQLLRDCPNGVYVQAYIYATPLADAEGAEGTAHSIPVLGFYGNWTDPSMYDKGSYQEYHYRMYDNGIPYYAYLGAEDVNTFMVTYGGNNAIAYAMGGNPVNLVDQNGTPAQLDKQYLESRNALNNQNGDMLYSLRHTAVRNSVATRFTATDANTGRVYYTDEQIWNQYSAYYNVNAGYWESTNYSPYIGWYGTDREGKLLPENTVVNIAYTRAPEYYVNEDGSIRWNDLGKGATFTSQITIDNTAPELIAASAANKDLTVTVHDNQYVAAVVLLDSLGQRQLSFAGGNQMVKNVQTDVVLHVDDVVGKTFMLQLFDYAMNVSTYQVSIAGMEPTVSNYYTGYDKDSRAWYGITETGETGRYALDSREIYAAERVGDLVFAVDSTQDNAANLYVMPADDLAKIERVGSISSPYAGETFYIADMAYHYPDRTMYFVYHCGHSDFGGRYGLATVDLLTGQADFETCGPLGADLRGLAIDDEGNFYGVGDNYRLYTYTNTTYAAPRDLGFSTGSLTGSPTRVSLTWDAQKEELVMADHRSEGRALYTVDAGTGAMETVSAAAHGTLWGLHVDSGQDPGLDFSPVNATTDVLFAESSVKVLLNATYQLSAAAYPWTLTDRSVTWRSSDSGIASVDQNGLVTGNQIGSCTITAYSRLDPTVFATCEVEVTNVKAELAALVRTSGVSWWSTFHTEAPSDYQARKQSAAGLASAVRASDGWIYGATWDDRTNAYAVSDFYRVDPETLEETRVGSVSLRNIPYEVVDLADAPNLGDGDQYIVGVSNDSSATNIVVLNRYTGGIVGVVSSAMGLSDYLVGIAYAGKFVHSERGTFDTYYAIDYKGKVYWVGLQVESVSDEGLLTLSLIGRTNDYIVAETNLDTDDVTFYNSLHYTRDSSGKPFLFWSYYEWNNAVRMIAIDADKTGAMTHLSTFPSYVRFVGGLMDSDVPALSQVTAGEVTVRGGVNDLEEFYTANSQPETAPESLFPRSSASAVIPRTGTDSGVIEAAETGSGEDVVLQLRCGNATTNGLLQITYDPGVLIFQEDQGNTLLYSCEKEADGRITLGYADRTARSPGELLSQLQFRAGRAEFETEITVTLLQEGNRTGSAQLTVPVRREYLRHSVAFDLNGGQGEAPAGQRVVDGETVERPDDPTRDGYIFRFWSASRDGGAYNFGAPVKDNLTLYAIWQEAPEEEPTEDPTEEPTEDPTEDPTEAPTQPTGPAPTEPTESDPTEPSRPDTTGPTEPVEKEDPLEAFRDVDPDAWYSDYVRYMLEHGFMKGVSSDLFSPDGLVNRAMVVTILHRMEGEPAPAAGDIFDDVESGTWYTEAVAWAAESGIVTGYDSDRYGPMDPVTREQLAAILWRYAKFKDYDVAARGTVMPDFVDREQISGYARQAVSWAYERGILTGRPGNILDPTGTATRAEVCAMLTRFLRSCGPQGELV